MRIAIQGCGHGNLNAIYSHLAQFSPVDILLICGDFQALRHHRDLLTLACPPKYRHLGDFPDYYHGRRTAPVLTVFIGGNHEASSHLWDLYHGGWVAPNMYFLGFSGVVKFGGLRLAGISGLYDPRHVRFGYYEKPPLTDATMRSIYHTRELEYRKVGMLSGANIFMSHEWPHRIYDHGNVEKLLKCKPYFRNDIKGRGIGAPPLAELLSKVRPEKWFAAHMHVEFSATVEHGNEQRTEFLALDKCLPGRKHMQVIEMPTNGPLHLEYDEEWLSIVKAMDPYLSLSQNAPKIPNDIDLEPHREFVKELKIKQGGELKIPTKYMKPSDTPGRRTTVLQTLEFCKMLGIKNHWGLASASLTNNPDEIK
jgi:lariat debranching enzyme